jgi:regulator of protease activity HflC (stomatin/prohibitin superfamily)
MLPGRERVNAELRAVIDTPTDDWGISVDRDEIKDIALPEGMRPRDGASCRCRWR